MDKFFAQASKGQHASTGSAVKQGDESLSQDGTQSKKMPKGVVIGKDGKPCRSCTSAADWLAMSKAASRGKPTSATSSAPAAVAAATVAASSLTDDAPPPGAPADCPPDVERLGNHTWTLLHTMAASYPTQADTTQQNNMRSFLNLFGKLYPCWVCAEDFQEWKSRNQPRVATRDDLGTWMCEAHNEVNRKLGKKEFDCARWQERWRTGWRDGRCD